MEISAINITEALRHNIQNWKLYTALFNFSNTNYSGKPVALLRSRLQEAPTSNDWKWNDSSYVRLPCSKANLMPASNQQRPLKWEFIESVLLELDSLCKKNDAAHIATKFGEFIRLYNDEDEECNFLIFQDEELSQLLVAVLPTIIENALELGARLAKPIPILKKGWNHTLYLSRDLACSLLANAFLCTFPAQPCRDLAYINFFGLFHDAGESATSGIKKEKLKCILEYFRRMKYRTNEDAASIISFERRCVLRHVSWSCRSDQLCPVNVITDDKIERMTGVLQVDFANRCVGGGILNEGAFQEEIRFAISPELICARLFSESLGHQEVLVITGTKQFSSYSGYSSTLKFHKLRNFQSTEKDDLGRERNQVVAMDAYHFKFDDMSSQYKVDKIERELHKCNVGFISGPHKIPIATGNWGCGAFNGDPELKFLIQWMAASVNKRPGLAFFAKDSNQAEGIKKICELLIKKNVTVGNLYDVLSKCHDKCIQYRTLLGPEMVMSVFDFVRLSFSQKKTSNWSPWFPFRS